MFTPVKIITNQNSQIFEWEEFTGLPLIMLQELHITRYFYMYAKKLEIFN